VTQARLRTLTAILWVPVNLILLYLGNWEWLLWVLILAYIATSEMVSMLARAARPPLSSFQPPLLAIVFVVGAWVMPSGTFFYLIAPVLMGSLLFLLLSGRQANAFERWGLTTAACLYVSLLIAYAILLRNLATGRGPELALPYAGAPAGGLLWMGLALVSTWFFDTGAYLIGRQIGRRKLWPAVSPGKTWEGTIGGTLVAIVPCLAAVPLLMLSYAQAIGLGLLVAVLAQLGDLVESVIKRHVGVKDTGTFLPGHGGILDRLDGLLFSTVGVYYFALLAGR